VDDSTIILLWWLAVAVVMVIAMTRPVHRLRSRFSPKYVVRCQQKADDAAERRAVDRKAKAEREAQRSLDWALANPNTLEGRRYLEERLTEAGKQVEDADRTIRIYDYSANKSSGSEADEAKKRIADAEVSKANGQDLADQIRGVLGVTA